ncbi:MAG: WecB/TagA/CpsF family glycosyltransferase [Bacteroidia bacterium]
MNFYLSRSKLYSKELSFLPNNTILISTINAHSFNILQKDRDFQLAIQNSDILIPDGISIVLASKLLSGQNLNKIAGEDLFYWEMRRLEQRAKNQEPRTKTKERAKVMFLGSTEAVLQKIKVRAGVEFPNVEVHTYSPPYKAEFSDEDNATMIAAINTVQPDVLFVGMTAPKQEKWAWKMINDKRLVINDCHVCCIGAVFDFYAGTVRRAPQWMIGMD